MKTTIKFIILIFASSLFLQCTEEDKNAQFTPPDNQDISSPNDQYLFDNSGNSLYERFGTAVRWRWNDNFISPTQRATAIKSNLVIDATKLVDYLWIGPYIATGTDATAFIKELFPAELVYLGSYIYKDDGTRLLGYASGGARVTLLNLNALDLLFPNGTDWLTGAGGGLLTTVHHEFSHIVHQNYGIPVGFNTISENYIGNQWINIRLNDAIKLGMVRNYGTLNEYEDFCEIISHLLGVDKDAFEERFIKQQNCSSLTTTEAVVNCRELNEGRLLIKKKVDLVIDFYKQKFNVDLLAVRDTLQTRLTRLIRTGKIPE